jgi:hypothetical protein
MAADLPAGEPVLVAPTLQAERNTIREGLVPLACWRMDDVRFAFASSFVNPDARDEFARLAEVRKDHPGALLSLFGHADPIGDDENNKVLSGRRAQAVYAALARRTDMWEALHSHAVGKDRWGDETLRTMQVALGQPADTPLPQDAGARAQLFGRYMDFLCTGLDGHPFRLDESKDFLGKGADPDTHRGAIQGCGEFNPALLFSQAETATFAAESDTTRRDQENAPNRRVVGLFFAATSDIDLATWPCPAATAGTGGCRKRFWSDAARRRKPGPERRTASASHDTFACRFFDRLASDSPCGGSGKLWSTRLILQSTPGAAGVALADVPFTLRTVGGATRTGRTGTDGGISIVFEEGSTTLLEIFGTTFHLAPATPLAAPGTLDGAQMRLFLLGYMPGPGDGTVTAGLDRAILQYQADQDLDPDGDHTLTATGAPSPDLAKRLAADAGN